MKRKYWELIQAMPAVDLEATVRRFEELDLDGVWVPQLHSPPFVTLAAIAMCTKKIKLGTGIALAFTRSAAETAELESRLYEKIGRLETELDWLQKKLGASH